MLIVSNVMPKQEVPVVTNWAETSCSENCKIYEKTPAMGSLLSKVT